MYMRNSYAYTCEFICIWAALISEISISLWLNASRNAAIDVAAAIAAGGGPWSVTLFVSLALSRSLSRRWLSSLRSAFPRPCSG